MIRLIIFAPCEKLIVGQDNHSSLISVIEHIKLGGVLDEAELPENAGAPYKWSVLALWHREMEVPEPKEFEAKIELISPSGRSSLAGSTRFAVSNEHLNYRSVFDFPVFPIAEAGVHYLTLHCKQVDGEEFEQIGQYPIRLIRGKDPLAMR